MNISIASPSRVAEVGIAAETVSQRESSHREPPKRAGGSWGYDVKSEQEVDKSAKVEHCPNAGGLLDTAKAHRHTKTSVVSRLAP